MHPIDVHILRCPDDDPVLYDRMIELLSAEPVNIQEVPGVPGDLPQARKNGYLAGSAEYVTCVDSDDEIQPGVFSKINSVLAAYPNDLIVVNEEIITPRGSFYSSIFDKIVALNALHHLFIYKRQALVDTFPVDQEDMIGFGIQWLLAYMANNPSMTYIDIPGYKWFQREGSYSTQNKPIVDYETLENALFDSGTQVRILGASSFSDVNTLVDSGALYKFKPLYIGGPASPLELLP